MIFEKDSSSGTPPHLTSKKPTNVEKLDLTKVKPSQGKGTLGTVERLKTPNSKINIATYRET